MKAGMGMGMGMGMEPDDARGDVLAQLRAELAAVEPSPGFAAGVRARISERRVPRQAMWLAAAAAAAGLVTVASVAPPAGPEAVSGPPTAVVEAAVQPTALVPARGPAAAKPRRTSVPAPTRPTAAEVQAVSPHLEVLVPPDQAIAVRRLLLMHGAGRRFAVPSDGHAVDEVTGALLEVAPVEIPRVTIDLLPGSEPGMGGKVK